MTTRKGTVYALRNSETSRIFYIGSSIQKRQRKYAHSTETLSNRSHVRKYINANSIKYTYEVLEEINGERTEVLKLIRRLEQRYILKSRYPLINKLNPLPFITKLKNKYPWLSNKTLLLAIVKK